MSGDARSDIIQEHNIDPPFDPAAGNWSESRHRNVFDQRVLMRYFNKAKTI
jgi:hypothetical protein